MKEDLVQKKKKFSMREFLESIPPLKERRQMPIDIIANNRSFVGRASNRITEGQALAYEKGMKEFGFQYSQEQEIRELLANSNVYDNVIIDIGFGAGHSLCEMAKAQENNLFIGIETFKPGIGSLLVQVYQQKIKNIRVFHKDAVSVLFHMIQEISIDRIQIFFSDPWPKDKHHKRRLIQNRFIQLCINLLKKEGCLWIVSDWEPYARQIGQVLDSCTQAYMRLHIPEARYYLQKDDMRKTQLEAERSNTRFEQKGLAKGNEIHAFVYIKKSFNE